jgi:hypothetical protein
MGIHNVKGGKFQVSVRVFGKTTYVGTYRTEAEAVAVEKLAEKLRRVVLKRAVSAFSGLCQLAQTDEVQS